MPPDLVTALSLLPGTYAEALRLRIDGATTTDIAEALGLEHAAVDPLLSIADTKLRELLLTELPVPNQHPS